VLASRVGSALRPRKSSSISIARASAPCDARTCQGPDHILAHTNGLDTRPHQRRQLATMHRPQETDRGLSQARATERDQASGRPGSGRDDRNVAHRGALGAGWERREHNRRRRTDRLVVGSDASADRKRDQQDNREAEQRPQPPAASRR
jgi:hypothetical protein